MNATRPDEIPAVVVQSMHALLSREKLRTAFMLAFGRPPIDEEMDELWKRLKESGMATE